MVETKVYIFAKYFHFLRLWRILGVQIWESAIKYPQRLSAASCQLQAVSCHLVPSSLPQKICKSSPWSNFFYKVFWKNQLLNRTILSRRFRLLNFRHYNTVWTGSKSKKIADELSFPQMINWPYDLLSRMISWFAINRPVDNRIILGDAHHDHLAKMIRWPE